MIVIQVFNILVSSSSLSSTINRQCNLSSVCSVSPSKVANCGPSPELRRIPSSSNPTSLFRMESAPVPGSKPMPTSLTLNHEPAETDKKQPEHQREHLPQVKKVNKHHPS